MLLREVLQELNSKHEWKLYCQLQRTLNDLRCVALSFEIFTNFNFPFKSSYHFIPSQSRNVVIAELILYEIEEELSVFLDALLELFITVLKCSFGN